MSKIWTVAKKELWTYFSSPTAAIFLFTYLLASLFTFFWVEKFFSRNIADLKPLFEWMPVLLIFLVSTLTMRMWSDERRMGTIEFLLTLPVKVHELVLGKFFACLALVSLALLLTIGMPLTVGVLGPVDWGPVFAAYFASLMLAAAYIAVGLFVSSRSENQIISLIVSVCICGLLYVVGSKVLVDLFSTDTGKILRALGTGSRFEAVGRGMFDLRDIYYYISITVAFLALNSYFLERLKWENSTVNKNSYSTALILILANVLLANVTLYQVNSARIDLTEQQKFSISPAARRVIDQLNEPLTIKAYFSEKTHPLLAALVPELSDFLHEFAIASTGKAKVEILDPRSSEEIEAQVKQEYGIEPVPFQVSERDSVAMVSSYFDVVVSMGGKFEKLSFQEFIEVTQSLDGIDVRLKNPEYNLVSAIKKVLGKFNDTDDLFASIDKPIKFVAYVSKESLPPRLAKLDDDIKDLLEKYKKRAGDKLSLEYLDPSKDQGLAQQILNDYGFKPQALSIFAQNSFYLYHTIQVGQRMIPLGIPEDLEVDQFEKGLEAALQRLQPGFLKTAGLVLPPSSAMNPMMAQYGMGGGGKQFQNLKQKLGENYNVETVSLSSGQVPSDIDTLLIVAPKDLDEKAVFAIDQFNAKGGSVVIFTSPAAVEISRNGFRLNEQKSGLEAWLAHNGIEVVANSLVLDKQNSGFPEMRKRYVQGMAITEPVIAPYPLFPDTRVGQKYGLNREHGITSGLGQLTMAWAAPIVFDEKKNEARKVTKLITSSPESWRSKGLTIESNRNLYPETGFAPAKETKSEILGLMVEGEFTSFFKGKKSPLLVEKKDEAKDDKKAEKKDEAEEKDEGIVTGVIEKSPAIAKVIVFSSNEAVADEVLRISSMLRGSEYEAPLQLVQNALDWGTEDTDLLNIRSRSHFARTLLPLSADGKNFWEGLNYGFALVSLLLVFGIYALLRRRAKAAYKAMNLVEVK